MDREQGRARAKQLVRDRMAELRLNNRSLALAAGVAEDTIGEFVSGPRWPQMQNRGGIEAALKWMPGTLERIADGGEPVPLGEPEEESVSGPGQDAEPDEDSLLYRRPEGLSDAEWEQLKRETRTYIEWQLDRASQER